MSKKTQRNIQIIFTIALCAYAFFGLVNENGSIFFVIYLFWFDELIRNVSLYIQYKNYIQRNPNDLAFKTSSKLLQSRFFMLFIYAIFIVPVFGIFLHLLHESSNELKTNILIITFNNISFNICLLISIIREVLNIRANNTLITNYKPEVLIISYNLLTLHISIIFGALLWALANGKIGDYKLELGFLQPYAIGIPFFIIKLFFDIKAIKKSSKAN